MVRQFLQALTSSAMLQPNLALEVFIHMAHLKHQDGSSIRFSSEGRKWLPKLGLGVWPDRPAPAIWSRKDFDELAPGQRPRTLRNHVFRISGNLEIRQQARDSMLGWGSVIQILTPDNGDVVLQKATQLLLGRISDPSFTCFPFYLPLLEKKSLIKSAPEILEAWFCGALLYIRESQEDGGILIAGECDLKKILAGAGAEPADDRQTVWNFWPD